MTEANFFKTFAQIMMVEALILYFFVVLHKLNHDFFNVDVSCATVLLQGTRGLHLLPSLPDWVLSANAYFTIFIEILIPLLLSFKKTRNWGIVVGLVFHNIIAYSIYNGYYDFSSMIFAVYFLSAGNSFSHKILKAYESAALKKPLKQRLRTFTISNFLFVFAILPLSSRYSGLLS